MGYSEEYSTYIVSPMWFKKSNFCKSLTKNRCVVFPWMYANHSHHLTYRNLKMEIPVRDIVPLSKFAHRLVHLQPLWKNKKVCVYVNWFLRGLMVFWMVASVMLPRKKRK